MDSIKNLIFDPNLNQFIHVPSVVWTSGLSFDVGIGQYLIQGKGYNNVAGSIISDAADAIYPRIDIIVVDTLGIVSIIKGEAEASPHKPVCDPLSQLEVTHIEIPANSSVPGRITNELVYNENVEWIGIDGSSIAGVTISFNNTTTPFVGTYQTRISKTVSSFGSKSFRYISGNTYNIQGSNLILSIRTGIALGNKANILITLKSFSTTVGQSVRIGIGRYDFAANTSYQTITIPIADFVPNGNYINTLQVDLTGTFPTGVMSIDFDNVYFQNGTIPPIVKLETDPFYYAEKPTLRLKADTINNSGTATIYDLLAKEDKSNKVTSISSGSTDVQYPSAKLLYDQLGLKQNLLTNPIVQGDSTIKYVTPKQLHDSLTVNDPVDDIFDWSVDKYTPYPAQQSGKFDNSSTYPLYNHYTRLNYDGMFYANQFGITGYNNFSRGTLSIGGDGVSADYPSMSTSTTSDTVSWNAYTHITYGGLSYQSVPIYIGGVKLNSSIYHTKQYIKIDDKDKKFTIKMDSIYLANGVASKWLTTDSRKNIIYKDAPVQFSDTITKIATKKDLTLIEGGSFDTTYVYNAINQKVDKVAGKALSDNNFSDADSTKLAGINTSLYKLKTDSVVLSGYATQYDLSSKIDYAMAMDSFIHVHDTTSIDALLTLYKLKSDTVSNTGYATQYDLLSLAPPDMSAYKLKSDSTANSGYFTNFDALSYKQKNDSTANSGYYTNIKAKVADSTYVHRSLTEMITGKKSFDKSLKLYGDVGTVSTKNKYISFLTDSANVPIIKYQTHYWNGSSFTATYGTFLGRYAGDNNKGLRATGYGEYALYNNTGTYSSGFGHWALYENTGAYSSGFGYTALNSNTGANSSGFGAEALYGNTGNYSSGLGHGALKYNIGTESSGFGYWVMLMNTGASANGFGSNALYWNIGANSSGFGAWSMYVNTGGDSNGFGNNSLGANTGEDGNGFGNYTLNYNEKANNTAVGSYAWAGFYDNTSGNKTFDYTAIDATSDRITVTTHGFGSTGEWIHLKYTEGTSPITGLVSNAIYQVKIIDANTLGFYETITGAVKHGVNITAAGTGTGHTLTPQYSYTNTTVLGANSVPSASNQVVLGDINVTEIKSSATVWKAGTDTLALKSLVKKYADVQTHFTFGYGSGNAGDTISLSSTGIYGSFYHGGNKTFHADSMVVSMIHGAGLDTLGVQISWSDTLKAVVPTKINTTTLAVGRISGTNVSLTVGQVDATFDNHEIPPGKMVWMSFPYVPADALKRKPTYVSVSLVGHYE
jgi:hypothetical protein